MFWLGPSHADVKHTSLKNFSELTHHVAKVRFIGPKSYVFISSGLAQSCCEGVRVLQQSSGNSTPLRQSATSKGRAGWGLGGWVGLGWVGRVRGDGKDVVVRQVHSCLIKAARKWVWYTIKAEVLALPYIDPSTGSSLCGRQDPGSSGKFRKPRYLRVLKF